MAYDVPSMILLERRAGVGDPQYRLATGATAEVVLGLAQHSYRLRPQAASADVVDPHGNVIGGISTAHAAGVIELMDGHLYSVAKQWLQPQARQEVWRLLLGQLASNGALDWRLEYDDDGLRLLDPSSTCRAAVADPTWWLLMDSLRTDTYAAKLLKDAGLKPWP